MENLALILLISMATPIVMSIFVSEGRTRSFVSFMLVGIIVCIVSSEFSGMILNMTRLPMRYFTCTWTPLFEEILKALPILIYVFIARPPRELILEASIAVGIGFAVLENAMILVQNIGQISIALALIRGFGAGMMHGVCTLAMGYGLSFVNVKKKLYITGTVGLLCATVVYHSIYNRLAQSDYQIVGFILPICSFVPIVLMLKYNYSHKKKGKSK